MFAVRVLLESVRKVLSTVHDTQEVFGKCLFLPLLFSSPRLISAQNVFGAKNKRVFLLIFA